MFRPYEGCAWALKRSWKLDTGKRISKTAFRESLLEVLARCMTLVDPKKVNSGEPLSFNEDVNGLSLEAVHYFLSHQVVYVATPLAERLACSEITVNLDHLELPFYIFEICFEDDFEIIPGVKAASGLASVNPDMATLNAKLSFVREAALRMPFKLAFPPELTGEHVSIAHIQYRSPFEADRAAMYHARIGTQKHKGQTVEALIDAMTVPEHTGYMSEAANAPHEKQVQTRMMRIMLGVLCYLNTKDPDTKAYRDKNRPSLGDRPPQGILLGSTLERMPPGWHLRKAHWRFLKHDRYKRDQQGQARCVWVRAAEINRPELPAVPGAKITELQP